MYTGFSRGLLILLPSTRSSGQANRTPWASMPRVPMSILSFLTCSPGPSANCPPHRRTVDLFSALIVIHSTQACCDLYHLSENHKSRTGEMAQLSRTLAEFSSQLPCPVTASCNCSFGRYIAIFWPPQAPAHIAYTETHTAYTCIKLGWRGGIYL